MKRVWVGLCTAVLGAGCGTTGGGAQKPKAEVEKKDVFDQPKPDATQAAADEARRKAEEEARRKAEAARKAEEEARRADQPVWRMLRETPEDVHPASVDLRGIVDGGEGRPVGILACNDDTACAVLQRCISAGVRVPQEACILGVGNEDIVLIRSPLPLSNIELPAYGIGAMAAEMALVALVEQPVVELGEPERNRLALLGGEDRLRHSAPRPAHSTGERIGSSVTPLPARSRSTARFASRWSSSCERLASSPFAGRLRL